ncbi:MAG TPA: DUF427 domain-containing protein [Solirubrobacteraceae bacterium]|nr:DUF427 domain-containing protein [Solirubrobacteraceae bacterium]
MGPIALTAHRIHTKPSTAHVRVERDGQVLAESDRALELHERGLPVRYYLPREDVRMDLLEPSATTSHCPFKGDASYYGVPGARDAFWVYETPIAGREDIAGLLAPWPGRVDVIVD